jgi:hypothetical protein
MSERPEPTKGDFGWASLAGGRAVVPSEYVANRPYFGLEREAGYLWGTLRDEDGNPLTFMRRIPEPAAEGGTAAASSGSLPDKLLICAAWDGAEDMVLRKEARTAPAAGDITRTLDGDRVIFRADTENPMQLTLSAKDAAWSEDGVIDVAGPQVGPGLQWYLPGADAGIYYPTTTWQVEGTALGRPVKGFLFYEEAYVRPGGRLYVHHDPLLGDELHTTWYSWATRWDDGELEFGHFLFGHDRFSVAVIGNGDGDVRVPSTMSATVTRSDDGYWFDRIDYVLDGEEWEMVPAPQGHMTGLGRVPNPQQEGLMRRKGETRTPVVWMAWGESVPHHGEERVVRRSLIGHS